MTRPRTSIVVPTRNGRHRIGSLLDNLAQQTDQDFEVVVVVDGDADGTQAYLSRRGEAAVRTIVLSQNKGRAIALNAGFAAARGEILIRCDDDLGLEPDFVEHHAHLHREGDLGVITMCHEAYQRMTPYAAAFGIPADGRIRTSAFATAADQRWRWWGGCVSTTRAVHDRVGAYDEAYRRYGWEDVDWGYRLHLEGVPIVIPESFSTRHHGPVTSVRERAMRALHSGGARVTFEERHGPHLLNEPSAGQHGRHKPWNRMVNATSMVLTERTVGLAGGVLDRVIALPPPRIAEKAVSLLVEAAATSGRRHPERLRAQF